MKIQIWLKLDKYIGQCTWRPKYVYCCWQPKFITKLFS